MERVVITGMGVITPLGNDVDTFWNAMIHGKSGISMVDTFDIARSKSKIGGVVRDFDPESMFGREVRRMDRFCQFAMAATEQAVTDSNKIRFQCRES